MRAGVRWPSLLAAGALIGCAAAPASQGTGANPMTFFITSVGLGKGADLGGLEGADAHCQA